MTRSARRFAQLTAASVCAAGLAVSGALPAAAHDEDTEAPAAANGTSVNGTSAPPLTSNNVELVSNFPETQAISGDFSISTEHFYLSSLDSLSVFDISRPASPVLKGTVDNLVFENEAMNYGERTTRDGTLQQFVLVGVDLNQASSSDPQHVNVDDGAELVIVDVSNPSRPHIRSRVKATSSTHTVACVRETACNYVYSAGNRGTFSIFDLRNLDKPVEVDSNPDVAGIQGFTSPALDPAPLNGFRNGAGHKWNFDVTDRAFHTGAAGTAAFDVSNPRRPQLLTTTNAAGNPQDASQDQGYNNFIHHNAFHPRSQSFKPGTAPSLQNGNVLLITEEDYLETDCSKAGSFQTWKIGSFNKPDAITPLDKVELADLGGATEVVLPQQVFCSAHWFDYHPKGITAVAYYGGGVRLVDVRDPENIKSYGYANGGGQVWDSYWVPQRSDTGRALIQKTNILYSVDLVRGLDVFRVSLPGSRTTTSTAGTSTAGTSTVASHATSSSGKGATTGATAGGLLGMGVLASLGVGLALRRRKSLTNS